MKLNLLILMVSLMSLSLVACGKEKVLKDDGNPDVVIQQEVAEVKETQVDVVDEPYVKKDISDSELNLSDVSKSVLKTAKEGVLGYGDIYLGLDESNVSTSELFSDSDNKIFTTRYNDLSSDSKNYLINDLLTCIKLENSDDSIKSELFSVLEQEIGVSNSFLDSIWVDIILED